MNNNLQLVLKSSTTEMSLNDHSAGIYLTPELDGLTGLPEIRTTSGVNAGYDGGWTSAQKFDARSIVIRGTIANNDKTEVERMRRELVALLAQGKNEQLELDFVTETGRAYEVQVRTIACDMALQKVLTQQDFMITLRADDPLIYDNSSAGEEATVNISGATGGFRIPFEIPLAIDAGSEETLVENTGLEAVAPTVKMYGALHNPKIINHTTNQSMQIQAELGFAEGDWITPSEPVEGKDLTINGAPENALIADFGIKGNTSQQTYSGKNLFNYTGYNQSSQGLTNTLNQDGTITTTGVPTANYARIVPNLYITDLLEDGEDYIISKTNADGNVAIQVQAAKIGGGIDYYNGKFTVNKSTHSYYLVTAQTGQMSAWGDQPRTITCGYQLEKGSTSTAFEPYVGGVPAPNPDYPQAVQTVTGENVVKINGKNLFDKSNAFIFNGYMDWQLSLIAMSGLTTVYIPCEGGATYTIQKEASGTNNRFCVFTTSDVPSGSGTALNYVGTPAGGDNSTSLTITTNASAKYLCVFLATSSTTPSVSDILATVQIELGSTATTFEPYQGQSYEVNLGKNLFDKDNAKIFNGYLGSSGIVEAANARAVYIPVVAGQTYTFSRANSTSQVNDPYYAFIANEPVGGGQYLEGRHAVGQHDLTFTGTAPAGSKYLIFYFAWNPSAETLATILSTYQLELGSTPTPYAAYFTPIELCKIGTYQDYIYKNDGKWYVHKAIGKYVYNNDLGQNGYDTNHIAMLTPEVGAIPNLEFSDSRFYCNMLIAPLVNYTGIKGTTSVGRIRVEFSTSFAADYSAARELAAKNNLCIYFLLNEATDTEITNSALVAQLEALLQEARMHNPQTNITALYAEGNEQGTLSISYYTDKNPDVRDELIIDSRLRTITLNGLDVYHLQAPGSEFLMLAPGENKLSLQSDIVGDNGYAKVSYKQGYLSI